MSKNMNFAFLLDFYKEFLTDKQADAIDLYYNEDMSLAEIGEHIGITRQGVRDNIKRGEAVLSELEDKIGIADRYKNTFESISKSVSMLDEIESIADKAGIVTIIRESRKIKDLLEGVVNGI